MQLIRVLLFPIALVYGLIVLIRNFLFDKGILPSRRMPVPVIAVGNLSTGGTGKTPHIEYIIRALKKDYKTATLSRGYGRTTKGFILASEKSTAGEIGDEPLQLKKKYGEAISVAVCEKRVKGIEQLMELKPETEVILLDDAFQHRYVKPGFSILLTEYNKLYADDFVLPTGNLREWASGASRADSIIVTKTPAIFSPLEKRAIVDKIKPKSHQEIYFSYIEYGDFIPLNRYKEEKLSLVAKEYYFEREYTIVLLSGIANPDVIEGYLQTKVKTLIPVRYHDHHKYSVEELVELKEIFNNIVNENKIIVTTEKDAMRLLVPELMEEIKKLPVFYLPIQIAFHDNGEIKFTKQLIDYVKQDKRNYGIH